MVNMAAEVSSLVRLFSGYKDDRNAGSEPGGAKSTALITRDLLGGATLETESLELDLDLQVPSGWEKRLDLKSGKVYLQRCNPSNSPSPSSDYRHQTNQTVAKLQDLNFPPSPSKATFNLFDEGNLELKLVASPPSSSYRSVCTLDSVKSALERAERELGRKRSASLWKSSMSPPYSSSSSSCIREIQEGGNDEKPGAPSPVAAGCPGCLSYVLIMKNNPKCPRCNSAVPMPMVKKPRIDLNISI
ncbi:hypothetical protein NC652_019138 [Populus alba x Populus x berolinensis]|uniref:GIR1-like zinc ribbon domain-containing protein n=1 Tax=Populus tomentosa TaxID=118781 RepID=A0A8X7ZGD9_POPTO|nr:hypothetical protein POTOM_027153 [Populus tomentosa]KAJ6916630.1 hypothetical protein NC652_019138 [Populus alba x Populus x berolinensis]